MGRRRVSRQVQARRSTAIELPPGYRLRLGGSAEQMADTFGGVVSALLLAVVFIYIVLASQFGSFLQPLAIMMARCRSP